MMRRPTFRRSLGLETLESREVLSSGGPSAEAQQMLWLLNYARTNPQGAANLATSNLDANEQATVNYYNVDLNAVRNELAGAAARPPLAWNSQLTNAATGQSQYQADNNVQSHTGANGSTTDQRLDQAGYTNRTSAGENAYAYSQSVDQALKAFLIDWGVSSHGHRNNILQPDASPSQYYKEVGVGIVNASKGSVGPQVITEDFGTQANTPSYLLGVAYDDPNHTHLYTQGTGRGDVEIDATNTANGQTQSTRTWDAGGYQIPLTPGNYDVTASVNGQVVRTDHNVNIGSQNVEVDYDLSDPWQGGSVPTPTSTSAPTPAPTPNPAPVLQTQFLGTANVSKPDTASQASQLQTQAQAPKVISASSQSAAVQTAPSTPTASPAPSFGWSMWTARRS